MSGSNWREWAEPDLSHAAGEGAEPGVLYDGGRRRRSILPDPLAVLIAAESGRPILVPIFPAWPRQFTPVGQCDHKARPIPDGSPLICMDCHDTGLRDHPAVRLTPADEIGPDPKPEAASGPARAATTTAPEPQLTRKQRRALRFAQRGTDADARDDAEPPVAQR